MRWQIVNFGNQNFLLLSTIKYYMTTPVSVGLHTSYHVVYCVIECYYFLRTKMPCDYSHTWSMNHQARNLCCKKTSYISMNYWQHLVLRDRSTSHTALILIWLQYTNSPAIFWETMSFVGFPNLLIWQCAIFSCRAHYFSPSATAEE